MEVKIHRQIKILEDILPDWTIIKKEFHEVTIFQDINWILNWWKYKSNKEKNISPYIVEIKNEKKTIGIIPLYISLRKVKNISFLHLKPMGDELSDYLLPILSLEYPFEDILNIAFEKIYDDKINWDFFEWRDVPENSFLDAYLSENPLEKNLYSIREKTDICPYLMLNKDFEEVTSNFSKKFLKGILYYERKLNRIGQLTYKRVVEEKEIIPIMNVLFRYHCERWKNTKTPSRFNMMEDRNHAIEIAKYLFNNDLLHLAYIKHDDKIAAIDFGMRDGKSIYLYMGAFNSEYKKYPVGHILLYYQILECCNDGYEIMDFLRGDQTYKQRVGTKNNYNVKYVFFNRTAKSMLYKSINYIYQSDLYKLYAKKIEDKTVLASTSIK